MIMEHVVDLYGQLIMWHTDVGLVVYLLACLSAEIVSNVVIILVMISICFVLKQVVHVIVEIQVL
jgi:hypothetical protein